MQLKQYFQQTKIKLANYNYEWKFKCIYALPLFIVLISFDWIVKAIVVSSMKQGETKTFIPGFLNLHYTINLGSAYGTNNSPDKLATTIILATLFTLMLFIIFVFINSKKWIIVIVFMLGGAFANLLARAWAPTVLDPTTGQAVGGGVVDMFEWGFSFLGSDGYIFNIADFWVNVAIVLGIICVGWEFVDLLKNTKKERKREINNEIVDN